MRKLIIALSLFTIHYLLFTIPAYAEYTGGSGDGWGYSDITSTMYHGGAGDGHSIASYDTDTEVGFGAATKVAFTTHPGNEVKNRTFATNPVLEIQDSNSNKVATATDTITLAILNDGAGGGSTLSGTLSRAASSGSATFSGLSIDQNGDGFTFSASATGLTTGTSNSFNVAAYGSADNLVFTTQPANSQTNTALITMPVVEIRDVAANKVANATNTITLAATSGGGGTLYTSSGGTPVTKDAVAGVADWTGSGIFIDLGGNSYELVATATGITQATSDSFNVTTAPETSAVSAAQATDGSKDVTISYTVTDAEGDDCNFTTAANQVQYSLDNSTWSNATVSGTTSGITSSSGGTAHTDLVWEAGTDSNNTEDSAVFFRIKIHDGTGYESDYNSTASSFVLDTQAPQNVSISSPANNATGVSLIPTFTATTATDATAIEYYFQLASNIVFTTDEQNTGWQAGTSWALSSALSTDTNYYVRVKARDAYGNESVNAGSTVDTAGYTTFTTTATGNAKPTVSAISGSQLIDGTKKVLITYTVADGESDNCDLTHATTQAQYSVDNSTVCALGLSFFILSYISLNSL